MRNQLPGGKKGQGGVSYAGKKSIKCSDEKTASCEISCRCQGEQREEPTHTLVLADRIASAVYTRPFRKIIS